MSAGLSASAHLRARRWDVVVVGSALCGLAAAVRLAMGGLRVLVVEEDAAARTPALLREPFFIPSAEGGGLVDACLRALGVPIVERRSLAADALAYQVLLPDARLDVGGVALTAEELVAWGLAKPDLAEPLVRDLREAGRAEGEALLASEIVRRHARSRTPWVAPANPGARGLPAELAHAEGALARFFELQQRALSNLGAAPAPPEARARLLGAALGGGASFSEPGLGLRTLLRRRIEALHGEFRVVSSPFRIVELSDHPGIARIGPDDVWLGRALILNAPASKLAAAFRAWGQEVPRPLDLPLPSLRRLSVHLRATSEVIPEPLARRAILEPSAACAELGPIAFTVHPSTKGSRFVEVVAQACVPDQPERDADRAQQIAAQVAALFPAAEGRWQAAPLTGRPVWDDEAALIDPEPGRGWPQLVELRVSLRKAVYLLPREQLGALGIEGDLLLGWRAGDAIREELS